ncbi:MAG TPA: J domain-containing protein [Tepidisphaeraceae bacterium]|jgi:curved DNA-binding protein CbpA|nr:J domain-containing protein [Tepidisphaeraceae bacterium]
MATASSSLPDAYAVLSVARTAKPEEIRAAHRRMVRAHHPDANQGQDAAVAQRRFQQVQEAYDLLRDPARRAELDRQLQRLDEQRQRAAAEAARAAAAAAEKRRAAQAHERAASYDTEELERERLRRDAPSDRRSAMPRDPYATRSSDRKATAASRPSPGDERHAAPSRRAVNPKFKAEQDAIDRLIRELEELRSFPDPEDAPPPPPEVRNGSATRVWWAARDWVHWLFDGYNAMWTVGAVVTTLIATSLAMWGFDRTRELVGVALVLLLGGICVMIVAVHLWLWATWTLRQLLERLRSS